MHYDLSGSREDIQAQLVNARGYRTHYIKRPNLPRSRKPPNPAKLRDWTFGAFRGWVIGEDYEMEDYPFVSVTIYLADNGHYMAAVEEGFCNPAEEGWSVFHASDSYDTPSDLYGWLEKWKHCPAKDRAWEQACRTYPPMMQGGS